MKKVGKKMEKKNGKQIVMKKEGNEIGE